MSLNIQLNMNKSFHEIFNTNPRLSTSISFILGLLLVDNLTAPEQNMLGNWIILLGQTILTNAASQNIIEGRIKGGLININSKEAQQQAEQIKQSITDNTLNHLAKYVHKVLGLTNLDCGYDINKEKCRACARRKVNKNEKNYK